MCKNNFDLMKVPLNYIGIGFQNMLTTNTLRQINLKLNKTRLPEN